MAWLCFLCFICWFIAFFSSSYGATGSAGACVSCVFGPVCFNVDVTLFCCFTLPVWLFLLLWFFSTGRYKTCRGTGQVVQTFPVYLLLSVQVAKMWFPWRLGGRPRWALGPGPFWSALSLPVIYCWCRPLIGCVWAARHAADQSAAAAPAEAELQSQKGGSCAASCLRR